MPEHSTAVAAHEAPDAGTLARKLCGKILPGGEFLITGPEASLVGKLVQSAAADSHPILACIGSLRTLGFSIGDMCALCDFDLADGPLLGELEVEFDEPLRAGFRYVASGTIESYDRVASRRLGPMDKLRFLVRLATVDGAPVARVRYTWLLPRGRRPREPV